MQQNIVVVGAGVVGASIAASLAERGARVTVVDQGEPGAGTSSTSFGWINSNGKEPQDYFEINRLGMEAHRRIAGDGLRWLGAGGHIEIAVDPTHQQRLEERVERLVERDYAVEILTPGQATDLMPDIRVPEIAPLIAHFPHEGYAYPAIYLAHALGRLRAAGGALVTSAPVVEMTPAGGGASVRLADGRAVSADRVISAAGRWTSAVAALAGLHMPMHEYTSPGDATVGYLLETSAVPMRLDHVVTTPLLNLRPAGGGRLLLQALDLDVSADPGTVPARDSTLASDVLGRLRQVAIGADAAQVEKLVVGQRSLPVDGRTIAGADAQVPWLYLIATHSGITLAPFLGEAVADEINGKERAELAGFRPGRFRQGTHYVPTSVPRRPGEQ